MCFGPGGQKGAQWASGASSMYFGGNFITQNLLGTPKIVGVGHLLGTQNWIWKDFSQVFFWRCGASLSRRFYKKKVVVFVPNRYFIINSSQ